MEKAKKVQKNLTLIYWKGNKFWLGKLVENPEIMSQGRTIKELIENIKDAYLLDGRGFSSRSWKS